MRVLVLGSGAGGGVPQWNCRCAVCDIAWADPTKVKPRTETSVAVTADDKAYVLFDAAPELRQQILAAPALHPRHAGRHSPIAAVFLSSSEVDHVSGLLCLREGHAFTLYGTGTTLDNIAASPIFDVLRQEKVARTVLKLEQPVAVAGLTVSAFAVPGKVPLYRETADVVVGETTGDVVGFEVSDGQSRFAYVPGIAHIPPLLQERLAAADLLMLDGTTFEDDELIRAGLSGKTAARMGHMAMNGTSGSLNAFAHGAPAQKVYIHLNNTNPVLIEDSIERNAVINGGWTVAHDGLEIVL